jgi:hypothetical protein
LEWKREWTAPTVAGVISFGAGVAVGYALKAYLEKRNERIVYRVDEYIEESTEFAHTSDNILDLGDNSVLERDEFEEVEPGSTTVSLVGDEIHVSFNDEPVTERDSVFPEEEDWDYEEELKHRTPNAPYIIHRDEYYMEPNGYSQTTLTYYAADEVLVDTDDSPIYNHKELVGELIFGKGSGDPSVVHIRNDKLEAEYEVLLEHGYYQVEVLGEEIEHRLNTEQSVIHKLRPE